MPSIGWLDQAATPLASATLRGAIILGAALLLTSMLRRRSAASRHAVWTGAIVMQGVMLCLAAWGPHWRVEAPRVVADAVSPIVALPEADRRDAPAPGDVSRVARTRSEVQVTSSQPVAMNDVPTISAAPATARVVPVPVNWRHVLLVLWFAGAAIVLLRLAIGTVLVATLARRGTRVDDGAWLSLAQRVSGALHIARPLILMRGARVGVPITWGIVYPVVLLPDDAGAWPEERRRFVLVHEMAHVKRLDALTQLVGQLVLAVFWFNPLVWVATRRMQLEREHACDDYVLRHGIAPATYAEELLAMVRRLGSAEHRGAQPAFAALAMARRSEFEGRMLSILDPVQDRHPLSRGRTAMSVLAALLVVVPLAALQPYRPAQEVVPPAPVMPQRAAVAPVVPAPPVVAQRAPSSAVRPLASVATPPASPAGSLLAPPAPVAPVAGVMGRPVVTPVAPPAPGAAGAFGGSMAPRPPVAPVAAPPVTSAAAVRAKYNCDNPRFGAENHITSIHSNDDGDGSSILQYYTINASRCAEASILGRVTYASDESDVADVPNGAHTYFRERTPDDDRQLNVMRVNGTLVHSYTRNGASTAWNEDGQRWLAGFLPVILAEAGLNVKPRVERWRAQGGVDRALRGIAAMRGTGARRSHYLALMDGPLSRPEMERVVKQAGRDLAGSSGDMRAVLGRAALTMRGSGEVLGLVPAIAAIPSSGDRTAVLLEYADTDNRDVLLALARVAADIPSSGDRARALRTMGPRYLAPDDRALREAYFAAVMTIPSSGDLRGVLTATVPYATRSEGDALAVIDAARRMPSSGDRAGLLLALAQAGAVRSAGVRDAYQRAAMEIPSSGDMRRAAEAVGRP